MFEALRCIFVPYRPRAIEDRLLGLPAEEPALHDFGSKLTLARMSTHFAEGFAHQLHPPPQERRKSRERELPRSQPGKRKLACSANRNTSRYFLKSSRRLHIPTSH
jgi:hypothetical protein